MSRGSSVRVLVVVVSAAVVAAVVAGLVLVGSPGEARLHRLDRRRVDDLYAIIDKVNLYWARKKALPADLNALADEVVFEERVDPVTGAAYDYRVLTPSRYEVCATFAISCQPPNDRCWDWQYGGRSEIRQHGAGEQCFQVTPKAGAGAE